MRQGASSTVDCSERSFRRHQDVWVGVKLLSSRLRVKRANLVRASKRASAQEGQSARSRRGALIRGMSGRLPKALLDSPVFREQLDALLKEYPGIYALYSGRRLYYVGLAGRTLGRIRHHLDDRLSRHWDSFVVFLIKRPRYLKDIETLAIALAKPKANKQKGHVLPEGDINRLLQTTLTQHQRELKALRKALHDRH